MDSGKKWYTIGFSFRTIIIYFNNVACGIKLFADDTKIYSTIKDTSDTLLLQKNLGMVNEWSHKWLLKFNVDKYKLLQLGNSSPANYYAKQKHLGCKKGEANQKQQLSDYKSIHSYTCD